MNSFGIESGAPHGLIFSSLLFNLSQKIYCSLEKAPIDAPIRDFALGLGPVLICTENFTRLSIE